MIACALEVGGVSLLHELVHEFGVLEHHNFRRGCLVFRFVMREQGGLRSASTSLILLEVKAEAVLEDLSADICQTFATGRSLRITTFLVVSGAYRVEELHRGLLMLLIVH